MKDKVQPSFGFLSSNGIVTLRCFPLTASAEVKVTHVQGGGGGRSQTSIFALFLGVYMSVRQQSGHLCAR